jgi:hypothetical protein
MPIQAHRGGGASALFAEQIIDTYGSSGDFGAFSNVSYTAPNRRSGCSNHSWREILSNLAALILYR